MFEEKTITALKWIIEILSKKNIPYQISGGFAAKMYGSNRSLNDIDIDIPESTLNLILEEVTPYITYPLQQYKDGKWDMQLMTLNYNGQEIDIGGGENAKISNKERTAWLKLPVDFSNTTNITIEGIQVSFISPEKLIEYKKHLDGEHQKEDIDATEYYIKIKNRL